MSKEEKRFIFDRIEKGDEDDSYFLSKVFVYREFSKEQAEYFKSLKSSLFKNFISKHMDRGSVQVGNDHSSGYSLLFDYSILDNVEDKKELKVTFEDNLNICIDTGTLEFKINKHDLIDLSVSDYRKLLLNSTIPRVFNEDERSFRDKYSIFTLRFEDIEKAIFLAFGVVDPSKEDYFRLSKFMKTLKLILYHNLNLKVFYTYKESDIIKLNKSLYYVDFEELSLGIEKQTIKCELFRNGYFRVAECLKLGRLHLIGQLGYSLEDINRIKSIELRMSDSKSYQIKNSHLDREMMERIIKKSWLFQRHYNRPIESIGLSIDDII